MTKTLIIGYGSIGRQHHGVLTSLGHECSIVTSQSGVVASYPNLERALAEKTFDYVVVASPTVDHRDHVVMLANLGFSGVVLVEKPLFSRAAPIPANRFQRLAVGYQLRFHPVLCELRKVLQGKRILTAHVYCGQHLSQWRQGRPYQQSYSASRARGGGVVRDLSHELDYLVWLFGAPKLVRALGGHVSSLEIDSEDAVGVLFSTEKAPLITLSLNYLDKRPQREIRVVTEDGTWSADLRSNVLIDANGQSRSFVLQRGQLLRELHTDILSGAAATGCSGEEGALVMELIERIDSECASQ